MPEKKSYPKRKFLFLGVFIILAFAAYHAWDANSSNREMKHEVIAIQMQDGEVHEFDVEVALSQEEHMIGLMWRTQMDDDAGMLFVFDQDADHMFWMKNTLIPLDMLFIKKDGTIHHIHENAIPKDETHISSRGKVRAVLELNGGRVGELGITVGDTIESKYLN